MSQNLPWCLPPDSVKHRFKINEAFADSPCSVLSIIPLVLAQGQLGEPFYHTSNTRQGADQD